MYIYKKTEPGVWAVGQITPSGNWEKESEFTNATEAAQRTIWLNKGDTINGDPE